MHRQIDRRTDRQTDSQTDQQTDRQTKTKAYARVHTHTDVHKQTDRQTDETDRKHALATKFWGESIAGTKLGPSNHNFAGEGPRARSVCDTHTDVHKQTDRARKYCGAWFEAPKLRARRRSFSGCIHFAPAQLCHGQHHGRQGELSTRARLETCSKVRLCVCMRM